MSVLPDVPQWFKRTPFYRQLETEARTEAEARRAQLAAERDAVRVQCSKDAGRLTRAADAARKRRDEAEAAALATREALLEAERARDAATMTGDVRIARLDAALRQLAHPCIADALARLHDHHEAARCRVRPADAGAHLAAIRAAREALEALQVASVPDPEAAVREILDALPAIPAAAA